MELERQRAETRLVIRQQVKDYSLTLGEAKVLSTDPYFVGNERDYAEANWVAEQWDKMMRVRKKPLHLRGFHYFLLVKGIPKPDGVKYAHTDPAKDWSWLQHAVKIARYLGVGEWQNFVDLKHPEPADYDNYFVGSGLAKDGSVDVQGLLTDKLNGLVDEFITELLREAPRFHTQGYSMWHLEIWIEKQSMGLFIEPVCRKYGACYQALVGQSSVEKVQMGFERALKAARVGKKTRIFYISDRDRYGCFAGSTLVTMRNNEKLIRNLRVGDELLTLSEGNVPISTKVLAKEGIWVPLLSLLLLKFKRSPGVHRKGTGIVRPILVVKSHPFYTYNRGWVTAEDLEYDDVLPDAMPMVNAHKNKRPRPMNRIYFWRRVAENPEILVNMRKRFGKAGVEAYQSKYTHEERSQIVKNARHRFKEENPERWEQWMQNILRSLRTLPTKFEQNLIKIFEEADLPVEYIGDGRSTSDGKRPFIGGFCPDFRVTGDHKVIEASCSRFLEAVGVSYGKYKEVRRIAYTKAGYKVLFLDLNSERLNKEAIVKEVLQFISNGATLVSRENAGLSHIARLKHMNEVRRVPYACYLCQAKCKSKAALVTHLYSKHNMTAPQARQAIKINYQTGANYEVKVYRMSCEEPFTFLANGILVHNDWMPAATGRKLEFLAREEGLDVKLTRIALTDEQIAYYKLPKAPKHGEDVVELDALEAIYPGELGKIVEQALKPYHDAEKPRLVEEENRRIRDRAKELVEDKLRQPLEVLFAGLDLGDVGGFSLQDALDNDFVPPEPGHNVEEGEGWIVDTGRSYWEQIEVYRRFKASRQEEEV